MDAMIWMVIDNGTRGEPGGEEGRCEHIKFVRVIEIAVHLTKGILALSCSPLSGFVSHGLHCARHHPVVVICISSESPTTQSFRRVVGYNKIRGRCAS